MTQKRQPLRILIIIFIAALAGFLRWKAVNELPVDFDELAYLPVAFRYEEMFSGGRWQEILFFEENLEHPPLNKLIFAADLHLRNPKEPNWDALQVGQPIPAEAQAAFHGPRMISAVGGTLQVLIAAIIHPLAGLLLALNTYHIKYSAQVYLEGIPGLMAILAVFLFELRFRENRNSDSVTYRWRFLILSAISLGLAAAGKYLYGLVGFVLIAFLIYRTRSARTAIVFSLTALGVFLLSDPFVWPHPPARLWESLTYHWRYSHSDHVVESAMPWYSPIAHLLRAAPTAWHPRVFYTGLADVLLLPLTVFGVSRAVRERPIWVAWAGFGLFFLLLWPTKWPQYILLILPPLAFCAAIGIQQIARFVWGKIFTAAEARATK